MTARHQAIASIASLQTAFNNLCDVLGPGGEYYSWFTTSRTDLGSPHVEYVDGLFYFVVTERGMEYERLGTREPDQMLYWLLSTVVSDIAGKYELRNRRPGEDSRRQYFAEQERLLGLLDPSWGRRFKAEIERVLVKHPFCDSD